LDASTVVAICATVIAVASLAVSVLEARAVRIHNRHSVRPILELRTSFQPGRTAGLRLTNFGLGPAAITATSLTFDGELLGDFDESNVNTVRDALTTVRPAAVTLGGRPYLDADYDEYLLRVEPYDPDAHGEFIELIRHRLTVEIHYESLYGGEGLRTVLTPMADPH
jgi:hypothetical protein